MKVDLGIWDKLTRVVIFLLFVAGILLVAIWYLPLIKQNERMRQGDSAAGYADPEGRGNRQATADLH